MSEWRWIGWCGAPPELLLLGPTFELLVAFEVEVELLVAWDDDDEAGFIIEAACATELLI